MANEPQKRDQTSPIDTVQSQAFKEMAERIFSEVYSQDDSELPLLPEKYRNFAFRWATEFRTTRQWSEIFHVAPETINWWKRNPKIIRYYFIIRRKHNLLMMERMKTLENKAFQKLYEILDLPVNDKNVEALGKMIMRILGVDVDGVLNLKFTAEAKAASASGNGQSAAAATLKAEASISLSQLRDRIDEWELMDRMVGPKEDKDGPEKDGAEDFAVQEGEGPRSAGAEEAGEGPEGD